MKNKKLIVAVIALVAVMGIMAGVWFATRPETQEGAKSITVTVVHKDGNEVVKNYDTDEEYLGPLLVAEGLVQGDEGEFGLYITAVDGEAADSAEQGWWAVYIGEESAMVGIDQIPVTDGGTYKLVYTIGW